MPLLYFTDVHIDKKSTKSVTRPCWDVVKEALEWISEQAIKYDVDGIICGGDVTERHNWTSDDSLELWQIFNNFPMPVYTVIGNHDVSGGDASSVAFSGIGQVINPGELLKNSNIKIGSGGLRILDKVQKFGDFNVVGYHWKDPLMDDVPINYSRIEEKFDTIPLKAGENNVLISHASVGATRSDFAHCWDELKIDSRIKYGFFGDIHTGFGPHVLPNGVIVGNPGAVYKKTFAEVDYQSNIYIVHPDKIEVIPIPHDPPEKAFYLEKYKQRQDDKKLATKTARIASRTAKSVPIKEFVTQVGTEAGYSETSIKELLSRL